MIHKGIERKALEIIAEQLELPINAGDRNKTFRELGATELEEVELHFTLADRFGYATPDDKEMKTLDNLRKTITYIQLNAPKGSY